MESFHNLPIRVRVASSLRKSILSGEIASGDELSLTDIAAKLGISRTPVREAFQMLAADGFITLRMNRGALVNSIDEDFIRDHFEMRMLLEGEAVVRAIKHNMDTSLLMAAQQAIKVNIDNISNEEYLHSNQQFHTQIWQCAGSPKLYSYLSGLWNGPSIGANTNAPSHRKLSISEHIQILNYIAAHDEANGRATMEQHIRRSMNNMLSSYSSINHS